MVNMLAHWSGCETCRVVGKTSGGWAGARLLGPTRPSLPSGATPPLSSWWISLLSEVGRTLCGTQCWTSLCVVVRGSDDVGGVRTATDKWVVAGFAARGLPVAGDAGGRPATPATRRPGRRRLHRCLGAGSGQVGGRRLRGPGLTSCRTRSWASTSASSFGDSLLPCRRGCQRGASRIRDSASLAFGDMTENARGVQT